MDHPHLSVGESILLIHALYTVIYVFCFVVIVSRNLERANENDGFNPNEALDHIIPHGNNT